MLTKKITISVVVPLYNKRETVMETLQSVINQSRSADEIIVVDDGSTDGGAKFIQRQFGRRITVIAQLNSGVSAARNRGVEAATGDYIAFLDADDLWAPQYLEEVALLAKSYPDCGMIGTRYQYIDHDESFVNPKINFCSRAINPPAALLQEGVLSSYFSTVATGDLPFNASTVTVKKSLLQSLNGFPEGEVMGEDQDVWARAALCSPIAYTPKVLGFYNRAADNRCCEQRLPAEECPFSQRLYRYAQTCDDRELADDIIDYTTAHLCYLAKNNIATGDYRAAQKLLSDQRCWRKPGKKIALSCALSFCQKRAAIRQGYQLLIEKLHLSHHETTATMINEEVKL